MPIPAGANGIISLDDVHAHLGSTNTVHDAELQGFIAAVQPVIENITGPIIATQYTEVHDGGGSYIVLRNVPVVSVQSITEYRSGTAVTLTGVATPDLTVTDSFIVEASTGIVRRYMGSGVPYAFWWGTQNISVTYTAGYPYVPANVRLAALELVRVNYQQTQQGGGGRQFGGANPDMPEPGVMMMGFFVPNRVRELLLPNQRTPGIA